jgi:hypothetical protein
MWRNDGGRLRNDGVKRLISSYLKIIEKLTFGGEERKL